MYNMRDTNLGRCSDDFYVGGRRAGLCGPLPLHLPILHLPSRPGGAACGTCAGARPALSECCPRYRTGPFGIPRPLAAPQPRLLHHPHLHLRLQLPLLRGALHPRLGGPIGQPGAGAGRCLSSAGSCSSRTEWAHGARQGAGAECGDVPGRLVCGSKEKWSGRPLSMAGGRREKVRTCLVLQSSRKSWWALQALAAPARTAPANRP